MIDRTSKSKITPSQITFFGLAMHLPIAWLIIEQQFVWAGVLLIIFGLFDTLDGELARLQKRTSLFGAFLDSSTDRLKEMMLYTSLGYLFAVNAQPKLVLLVFITMGISFLISYLNAAGDVATSQIDKVKNNINRTYRSGLAGFEIRISLLVIGLLFDIVTQALVIISLLGIQTLWLRFNKVLRRLGNAKN